MPNQHRAPAWVPRWAALVVTLGAVAAGFAAVYVTLGRSDNDKQPSSIAARAETGPAKAPDGPGANALSQGHPLGATGLAQCTELVWHLRGTAGDRQVSGAKVALQHNLGLGGACVVTMYRRD